MLRDSGTGETRRTRVFALVRDIAFTSLSAAIGLHASCGHMPSRRSANDHHVHVGRGNGRSHPQLHAALLLRTSYFYLSSAPQSAQSIEACIRGLIGAMAKSSAAPGLSPRHAPITVDPGAGDGSWPLRVS